MVGASLRARRRQGKLERRARSDAPYRQVHGRQPCCDRARRRAHLWRATFPGAPSRCSGSASVLLAVRVSWSRFARKQVQNEIVDGLGVLQAFVEFFARRLKKTLFVRIAISHRIGCKPRRGERVERTWLAAHTTLFRPCGTLPLGPANPAINRWAIFCRPCRTNSSASASLRWANALYPTMSVNMIAASLRCSVEPMSGMPKGYQ